MYEYIERFKNLGFGMFVHFGLYSVAGKGEWYLACNKNADKTKYEALTSRFKITKNWAKNLVKNGKIGGVQIYHAHHAPSRRVFSVRYVRTFRFRRASFGVRTRFNPRVYGSVSCRKHRAVFLPYFAGWHNAIIKRFFRDISIISIKA